MWIVGRTEFLEFYEGTQWKMHQKRMNRSDCPEEVRRGYNAYDIKAYNNWLINVFLKGKKEDIDSMAEEKLRYQKYRADREEMEAKKMAKELLPIKEVQDGLTFALSGLKSKLMAWIKRLPPMLIGHSEKEMAEIIRTELYLILTELSQGIKALMPKKKRGKKKK